MSPTLEIPAPASAPEFPSERVVGVRFEVSDYDRVLEWLRWHGEVSSGEAKYVCAANVADAMLARKDEEFARAMEASHLVVPDGMPIVWAMRSAGHEINTRVYGPTMMELALNDPVIASKRHVLIAGVEESRLGVREKFANVNWVGEIDFWFNQLDDAGYEQLANQYRALEADYGWVSLGGGKQILFMHRFAPLVDRGVLLGVGAAFDFHAGKLAQAPSWMQEHGLEWLFRLTTEPKRLWRRYLIQNPPFLYHWWRERKARR